MYQELGVDPLARMAFWGDNEGSTPFAKAHEPIGLDKKRSPHKARILCKSSVKIDNLTEIYVAELKKLKELASMSEEPEVYGEGLKILSFIKHVEEGRTKYGI